jgi:hypothetical protein
MATQKPTARFHRHVDLDDGAAFVPDFRAGFIEISDGDVEAFGEEFIASATSGEDIGELARDESYMEELGGFVVDHLFDPETDSEEPADERRIN